MKQANFEQEREAAALKIVVMAKSEYNFSSYYQIERGYFVLHSMIDNFKQRYVFNTIAYQDAKAAYRKGIKAWYELDAISIRLFKEQLKAIDNKEVDAFFRIVRIEKNRLKQIKRKVALAS